MKRALTIVVMVITLLSMLTLQSLAWSANINGKDYNFQFPVYSGVGSMPENAYFNEDFQNHITGYNFNNGTFNHINGADMGGDIRSIFHNDIDVVKLVHNSKYIFPQTQYIADLHPTILSVANENSWQIDDKGSEYYLETYNRETKEGAIINATNVERSEKIANHHYLRYSINADLFTNTIVLIREANDMSGNYKSTFHIPIDDFALANTQGLRIYMQAYIAPEWFRIENFHNEITVAPGGFVENPASFAYGYDYAYGIGEDDGYTNGYSNGYSNGYATGETYGIGIGYQSGLEDGEEIANQEFKETYGNNAVFGNFFNGLGGAVWTFINNCLSFELFPNVTIGSVVLVFVGAGVVIFLLKLLIATKGGGM